MVGVFHQQHSAALVQDDGGDAKRVAGARALISQVGQPHQHREAAQHGGDVSAHELGFDFGGIASSVGQRGRDYNGQGRARLAYISSHFTTEANASKQCENFTTEKNE